MATIALRPSVNHFKEPFSKPFYSNLSRKKHQNTQLRKSLKYKPSSKQYLIVKSGKSEQFVHSDESDQITRIDIDSINNFEPVFNEKIVVKVPLERAISEMIIEISVERAKFYLNNFKEYFENNIEPTNVKDCFGILYHRSYAPPIAMDFNTSLQKFAWSSFVDLVDDTNMPIFIFHTNGIKQSNPEEIKINYRNLFGES